MQDKNPQTPRRVAVFGATGHTGRFVVSELRHRGFEPMAVARNDTSPAAATLAAQGIRVQIASIEDRTSLDRAFAGTAAVINCAGPFLDTADAVAAAALSAGAHYLDVSAEQPSTLAIFDKFAGMAQDAGRLVIPAMGFYGGFADLLATAAMGDWDRAEEINIGIALDSWHPTRGTRVTGARNTTPRKVIANGRLELLAQPAAEKSWDFPEPFARQPTLELPFSETVLIARHLQIAQLHTYLNTAALRDIRDTSTPPPQAADDSGRSAQRFLVEAVARNQGLQRRAMARGRDIYAFSAPLVCEAVQRILDGEVRTAGAQAPGAIFDAAHFLAALVPAHLALEIEAG
ncbi:MAG: NAD(P)H-binding protein [Rhodospirillales bacterium]|nr:NAD(P)H-binding protein [Rhodospirillales bacterium]